MRQQYERSRLIEDQVSVDPFQQFEQWFEEAQNQEQVEANAMTLATASDGQPSTRIVLLKAFDPRGFVFYTNYLSRKGKELAGNSQAALSFYWPIGERQVRIEGIMEKISSAESDAYFQSRPQRKSTWCLGLSTE